MENFVVSARKYRPAVFRSVVGQQHITSTLKNAIARGQLAHAYLFCGPRGVGKTTCARIFAKAINCMNPVDAEACNECESCKGFNEGRSFNIHELDAASNNSVDDIRSLTDQVRIPPQIGRYSVYIIDEVHMLSAAAFNAFLKTLEEPPAHAIFILATTEKHKILPTILSRCQIFDFNRIRVEDGVSYLKYIASQEGITCDDESLHLIAQKADGGMRDALSMFDKAVSFCGKNLGFKEVSQTLNVLDYDTYFNVTRLIHAGDYPSALLLFDEVLRKGFSGQIFIAGLNAHFRDILMCKSPETMKLLEVTGTILERYRQQGTECDVGFLFEAIALLTSLDGTLRTASNQRLNVELGLMKLCGLGQKKNDGTGSVELPVLPQLLSGRVAGTATLSNTIPVVPEGAEASVQDSAAGLAGHAARQPSVVPAQAQPAPVPAAGGQPKVMQPPARSAADEMSVPAAGAEPRAESTPQPPLQSPVVSDIQPSAATEAAFHSVNERIAPDAVQTAAGPEMGSSSVIASAVEGGVSAGAMNSGKVGDGATADMPVPSVPPKPHTVHSISGMSISSIMNATRGSYTAQADDAEAGEDPVMESTQEIDPDSEQKILDATDRFLGQLQRDRPRIAMAFHGMEVAGNVVKINVPTKDLKEEIRRNQTEILMMLIEVAGLSGIAALEVKVVEKIVGLKPVKVEDRLRFLTEKNPLVAVLRKEMDLDVE